MTTLKKLAEKVLKKGTAEKSPVQHLVQPPVQLEGPPVQQSNPYRVGQLDYLAKNENNFHTDNDLRQSNYPLKSSLKNDPIGLEKSNGSPIASPTENCPEIAAHPCPPLAENLLGQPPYSPLEILETDIDDPRVRCWYCKWFLELASKCSNQHQPRKHQMRGMLHHCQYFEARS